MAKIIIIILFIQTSASFFRDLLIIYKRMFLLLINFNYTKI